MKTTMPVLALLVFAGSAAAQTTINPLKVTRGDFYGADPAVVIADDGRLPFPTGIRITIVDQSSQTKFAAAELQRAARNRTPRGAAEIILRQVDGVDAKSLQPEGFRIAVSKHQKGTRIKIQAIDPAGLMYGGLEVAEVIGTLGVNHVRDTTQNPYFALRGTKFNIPLDVRTPSYTDVCDAAQINIPEMWSFDFWRDYIDTLARYRYNYVSLWNLHPFPSLVKVPEYADVALRDVWRSRVKWKENYPLEGQGFVTDEILRDAEVVRRMTTDEKIDFWRRVMAYGKSRNVDFYIVTWNIFTCGTDGKYGITDSFRNPKTRDYFRCSVRELLLTYPDLAGVGLTTGENMPGADFQQKEDWAMATYGQGMLDVAKAQPDRQLRLIHRQHQANAADIARTFQPLISQPNVDFVFSFKYAKAHVYSATTQPFHDRFVQDLGDMKTIWTLRNDDVYYFRWGAPDFVREFVKNIPREPSMGYYYGSDQYIWGREFLQRDGPANRPVEIDKHWLQWLLWGRLAYDPDLTNRRIADVVADRFGMTADDGLRLLEAWQHTSMVYPITTGFHWGALDFQWYIEGCQSRPGPAQNETGFHDVNRFITLGPHANSNCQSIPRYVKDSRETAAFGKRSPLQVADELEQHVDQATAILAALPESEHSELNRTLTDLRIVGHLGHYYADKIRGATKLALFRETTTNTDQQEAIQHLVDAARHWHDYATLALRHHKNPLWTNRVGYVDWKKNYQHTLDDIRIAGGDPTAFELPAEVHTENERVRIPRVESSQPR